jgi:signal transduction histidine kinase
MEEPRKCITESLVASLIHDLKAPLTSIGGYAKRLRAEKMGNVNDEQRGALDVIIQGCERVERDLTLILEYFKGDPAVMDQLSVETFDVRELVDTRVDSFKPQAKEKNMMLSKDLPGKPVMLRADERVLDKALANLIDNAIEYTDTGGRVTVGVCPLDEWIEISVSDTGQGIDESKIDLILQPFEEVMSIKDRTLRGIGLGLSNVKRYVDLHNGELQVDSNAGIGSTFRIRLPRSQQE